MAKAKEIGNLGEQIAEKYLKKRCWKIISNNFSTHYGEIDLIAYRCGTLVYVEVKTRSNNKFGNPASAVDKDKLNRIKTTAQIFKKAYMVGGKIPVFNLFGAEKRKRVFRERIDVIEVFVHGEKYKINHIKSFEVGDQL